VVIARRPFDLVAGAQNLGSRETGREGVYVGFTANDLFGLGDRTSLTWYNTVDWGEQSIITFSHDFAIGADGLRAGASVLVGRSRPDVGAPFETDTLTGEWHLSYPFIRRQSHSLFGTAGFEAVEQEIEFADTLISEDQLRVAFLHLDHEMTDEASVRGAAGYSAAEPLWRTAMSLELRQGIGGLGASDDCRPLADCLPPNIPISNFAADPTSFVARLQGTVEIRPIPVVTFAMSPVAQISDGPLLSYEQISFGNYTVGRGFDPGIAVGDSGVGASFEVRYGSLYPREAGGFAFQPFAFLDIAKAWLDDEILAPDPRRVLSDGGGVRGRWGDLADFGVTVAVPLERAGYQTEKGDVRVLGTVTFRLLPLGE
jgi:hemolysin activation/secretion protein